MPKFNGSCKFNLFTVDDVYSNVPVINLKYIDYYIWFKLPNELLNSDLIQIDEISENKYKIDLNQFEKVNKLWLACKYDVLNLDPGQHIYKFSFKTDNDIISYYFSYIIQTDNPDKPYYYMTNERQE